jgi:hypothetical protein
MTLFVGTGIILYFQDARCLSLMVDYCVLAEIRGFGT